MTEQQKDAIAETLETFFRLGVMDARLKPHDIAGRVELSELKNKHKADLLEKLDKKA